MKKIAINGFGRIGRALFRSFFEHIDVEVAAINDLTDAKTLAHLLQYDSVYSTYKCKVSVVNDEILVTGDKRQQRVKVFGEKTPANLPWKSMGIDLVLESTGRFTDYQSSYEHIKAGAKKVLISAPASGELKSVVYNVNHHILNSEDKVVSAASCTTNCLSLVLKVLQDNFGIVNGYMNTIHSYTSDQRVHDAPHKDLRRARACAHNIIPTTTGAAKTVGKVIPELAGLIDGIAFRIPTISGSVIDLTLSLETTPTIIEINTVFRKAANESLGYCADPIVSSDIIGSQFGSIFDSLLTSVVKTPSGNLYKIFAWYDNESSFVYQMMRTGLYFLQL